MTCLDSSIRCLLWTVLAAIGLTGCTTLNSPTPPENLRISPSGMGPVELGMTPAQASAKLGPDYQLLPPPAKPILKASAWYRVLDGEQKEVLRFGVREGDSAAGGAIVQIRTADARFRLENQAGPGSSLSSLQKIWGPATLHLGADGFGTEQVRFERQPDFLIFTVGGPGGAPAGIYEPLTADNILLGRTTTQFAPDSRILTVTVRSPAPPPPAPSPSSPRPRLSTNVDPVPAPPMRARVNALRVD